MDAYTSTPEPAVLSFQQSDPAFIALLIVCGFLLLLSISLVVSLGCVCRRYWLIKKQQNLSKSEKVKNSGNNSVYQSEGEKPSAKKSTKKKSPSINLTKILEKAVQKTIKSYCLSSSRLELGEQIGQGQFGTVYKGNLTDKDGDNPCKVAVKTVQYKDQKEVKVASPQEQISLFLEEALRMRGFQHPNVLTMIGLVLREDTPYVVLPYMDDGDLRSFVNKETNVITIRQLIDFSCQIADGMAYLSAQEFIHRDLAARNCMIDDSRLIKIADFGLSQAVSIQNLYKEGDTKEKLPIRWMALECLTHKTFTSKSDVWSYGVLVWELFTRGERPYKGVRNDGILYALEKGRRLQKPQQCPENVFHLLQNCWVEEAAKRPTFKQLLKDLKALLLHSKGTMGHQYDSEVRTSAAAEDGQMFRSRESIK